MNECICVCVPLRCVPGHSFVRRRSIRLDWNQRSAEDTVPTHTHTENRERQWQRQRQCRGSAERLGERSAAQRRAEQRSAACRVRRRGAHTDESDDTDEQLDARTREPRTRTSDTDMTRCYLLLPTPTRDSTPNSDFYSTLRALPSYATRRAEERRREGSETLAATPTPRH